MGAAWRRWNESYKDALLGASARAGSPRYSLQVCTRSKQNGRPLAVSSRARRVTSASSSATSGAARANGSLLASAETWMSGGVLGYRAEYCTVSVADRVVVRPACARGRDVLE
jgi:hypothetical protein